jgi:Anti-sigma factor NepR
MTEPRPEPTADKPELTDESMALSGEERAKVRETLGEGLRKFYDSVLDEPIPADWLSIVGPADEKKRE